MNKRNPRASKTARRQKLAFISYRREDSSAASRSVQNEIGRAYGPEAVFMDVERIRIGAQWPEVIRNAIGGADVLIVMIGPTWLRMADQYGRRRLDQEGDWVAEEIALSLKRKIRVIPLLVSGATLPPEEALPVRLRGLLNSNAYVIHDTHWQDDLKRLFEELDRLGFVRSGKPLAFPKTTTLNVPRAFTPEELEAALAKVPGWDLYRSPLPAEYPKERVELMKTYQFRRFEDALAFMHGAVPEIVGINHHPRWENLFKTVTAYTSTWDSGHIITYKDIELAELLDRRYGADPSSAES